MSEAPEAPITYYCVVPSLDGSRLLLLADGDGWNLPRFALPPQAWFPSVVGLVNGTIRELLGLVVIVLREWRHGTLRLCELELHQPDGSLSDAGRWVTRAELARLNLAPAGLREALDAWFIAAGAREPPAGRPPWERRGWYAGAADWVRREATRLGHRATGPVEQVEGAWSWSTILRLPTDTGDLYFKAVSHRPPPEPALVRALAERWPASVPALVAVDEERRWMLMRDFGRGTLQGLPAERWAAAARRFAELQVDCSQHVDRWLALGCEDRRLGRLAERIDALLADPVALRRGQPTGVTDKELAMLLRRAPLWHEQCQRLVDYGIPASLVQQDFRHGNIAVTDSGYLFYDWSDTIVSHPFFSASRCLDYLGTPPISAAEDRRDGGAPLRDAIRDAYLAPWTDYAPRPDLLAAFALVRELSPVFLAVRWYQEQPHVEASSPWGKGVYATVPSHLKRLARATD